jgi:hypothetical protein
LSEGGKIEVAVNADVGRDPGSDAHAAGQFNVRSLALQAHVVEAQGAVREYPPHRERVKQGVAFGGSRYIGDLHPQFAEQAFSLDLRQGAQ